MKELPENIENLLLPLVSLNPKLVLGGSLCLHLLNIMDLDFTERPSDLDLSLSEELNLEELLILKDFFNLELVVRSSDYDEIFKQQLEEAISNQTPPPSPPVYDYNKILKKDLIQLLYNQGRLKIDIFNQVLKQHNIFIFEYKGFKLKMVYPSIILSHKSKYAYDNRVGAYRKHFNDLSKINWSEYFKILDLIQIYYENDKDDIIYKYNNQPKNENSFMWDNVCWKNQSSQLPF